VLNDYTRLRQKEIQAFYRYGGLVGSSGSLVLTPTHCHHPRGQFALQDLRGVGHEGKVLQFQVNMSSGNLTGVDFRCDSEADARLLADFFDHLIYAPQADSLLQDAAPKTYAGYSPEAVQWLEIRDEVLRTIDLLAQRFQDGRLNLLEYEEKKADLLSRL